MKNKTVATWLALLGGPLGLHRFYLNGRRDLLAWMLPLPTLLGTYGILRVQQYGLDDRWSWFLMPLLGFTVAGCTLTAIVYGLTAKERWNARFNASSPSVDRAGGTNWLTVGAVVLSLLVGSTVLIFSIAFSFQHYFEYQSRPGPR